MRTRIEVQLSKLHPGPDNPRKVKPGPEAHRRMVASIRAFKLLQPLVIRPMPEKDGEYQVIAGGRRLAALKEIHRNGKDDPKIPCELRDCDDATAEALSLTENFVRAAMHPQDEAEAFARLAADEAMGVAELAATFGTTERYIQQRLKLASLAKAIKIAFKQNVIDIGTAEVFASVPESRQIEIWNEIDGKPQHAQHVRNIIESAWIDSKMALFDVSTLPPEAVSSDLFGDRVLIERKAFMEAQAQALVKEHEALREEGWANVVAGPRERVHPQVYATEEAPVELDARTNRTLVRLNERRKKLEASLESVPEGDEPALEAIGEKIEAVEQTARQLIESAPMKFAEATKSIGTVFLALSPNGEVQRHYRVAKNTVTAGGSNGDGHVNGNGSPGSDRSPPTSDDLNERQLADTFAHQTLAVRELLLKAPALRKRLLVLILSPKLRSDALSVRHDVNAVSLHAAKAEGFHSSAYDKLQERLSELDPFASENHLVTHQAMELLNELPDNRIQQLTDLLVVETLTTHLLRGTELTDLLARLLEVDLRKWWKPDAAWLGQYQKIQLAHLIVALQGPVHAPAPERRKMELVEQLAQLFTDAADGKLEDKELAERLNRWLPSNLRAEQEHDDPAPVEEVRRDDVVESDIAAAH